MRGTDPRSALLETFSSTGPPTGRVVLVHPGAVPVAEYGMLADAFPEGTDTWVLNLERVPEYFQAALSPEQPRTSVDALALRCAEALREKAPATGPWTLVGWSFGGVVGHALTSLLSEEELPDRLILLDSIAAVDAYEPEGDVVDRELVMPWFTMYLGAKRRAAVLPPASAHTQDTDRALAPVLEAAVEAGALHPSTSLPGLRKVFDAYLGGLLRNARLTTDHEPAPARVPLTLIRPERGLLSTPEPLGWDELAPNLRTESSGGDHYTMLHDDTAVGHIVDALPHPLRP